MGESRKPEDDPVARTIGVEWFRKEALGAYERALRHKDAERGRNLLARARSGRLEQPVIAIRRARVHPGVFPSREDGVSPVHPNAQCVP
jgi:hypothetical protein